MNAIDVMDVNLRQREKIDQLERVLSSTLKQLENILSIEAIEFEHGYPEALGSAKACAAMAYRAIKGGNMYG